MQPKCLVRSLRLEQNPDIHAANRAVSRAAVKRVDELTSTRHTCLLYTSDAADE